MRVVPASLALALLVTGLTALPTASATSDVWYVATTGDDRIPTTAPATKPGVVATDCGTNLLGACKTITQAIRNAASNSTIQVAAGTYVENVSITKRINLLGPYADKPPWKYDTPGATPTQWGAEETWARIAPSSGTGVSFTPDANAQGGSVVKGLAITGGLYGVNVSGHDDLVIENNYIATRSDSAINNFATGDRLQIRGNLISGDPANTGVPTATGVTGINHLSATTATITDNKIVRYGRAIQLTTGGGTITVERNVFEDIPLRGVQLAGTWVSGTSVSIKGNDFINVNYAGRTPTNPISGESDSGMIRFHPTLVLPEDSSVTIANNSINQTKADALGAGITFNAPTTGFVPFSKVTIKENNFAIPPNAKAIAIFAPTAQPDGTLKAETNLWGSTSATAQTIQDSLFFADSNAQKVSVSVSPWITAYTSDPAKADQPGFWPLNINPPAPPAPSGGGGGGGGEPAATPTPTPTPAPAPATPTLVPTVTPTPTVQPVVVTNPTAVRPAQVQALSPAQIATVTPTVIGQLPPAAVRAITPAQAEALTPAQVNALRPTQAAALRPASVVAMSPEQLSVMRPASVASLNPRAICTPVGTRCVPGETGLTAEQVASFRPEAFRAMQPDQFEVLRPAQVTQLPLALTNLIRPSQALAMQPATVAALSPEQLAVLRPSTVRSLQSAAIARLEPAQVAALRPQAVGSMTAAQLRRLSDEQIAALTPRQRAALTPAQRAILGLR